MNGYLFSFWLTGTGATPAASLDIFKEIVRTALGAGRAPRAAAGVEAGAGAGAAVVAAVAVAAAAAAVAVAEAAGVHVTAAAIAMIVPALIAVADPAAGIRRGRKRNQRRAEGMRTETTIGMTVTSRTTTAR